VRKFDPWGRGCESECAKVRQKFSRQNGRILAKMIPSNFFPGLLLYFGYGLHHSKASEAVVQQPRRPTHLNLTPIIPEIEADPGRSNPGNESGIIRFSGSKNSWRSNHPSSSTEDAREVDEANGVTPTFDYASLGGIRRSKSKLIPVFRSTVESLRTPIMKVSNSSYEMHQNE